MVCCHFLDGGRGRHAASFGRLLVSRAVAESSQGALTPSGPFHLAHVARAATECVWPILSHAPSSCRPCVGGGFLHTYRGMPGPARRPSWWATTAGGASLGGARRVPSFVPVPCAAGPILRSFHRARVPQRVTRFSRARRAQWCATARVRLCVAQVRSCRAMWASTGRGTQNFEPFGVSSQVHGGVRPPSLAR